MHSTCAVHSYAVFVQLIPHAQYMCILCIIIFVAVGVTEAEQEDLILFGNEFHAFILQKLGTIITY